MPVSFKGAQFVKDIILTCVRWYVAYPLSYRQFEELTQERGVSVDHSTINRWVVRYSSQLEAAFHRRKRPVRRSWRMDETYVKVKGRWCYLYCAVDKAGHTVEHRQHRYLNNRAENSHQPTRQRERRMQQFKSAGHAQRFLAASGLIAQHFRPRRHRFSACA